jgi:hypothetical protein
MPGSPLTGQGGQFGGPQFGWGDTPGGGGQSANSGPNRGRYTNSPEAGLHRGEWQWRGHGPSAQQSYGWDYQGGVGRDEITQRTEARMGSSFQARMAQERSGGLPQGRYAIDYDQGQRTGTGQRYGATSQRYGNDDPAGGMQGGGAQPRYGATSPRYGGDYPAGGMQGGGTIARFSARDQRPGGDVRGGGYGASEPGYGGGYPQGRSGYDAERGYGPRQGFGGGMRAGGYGAQGYDRGMRGGMSGGMSGGGYGARYGGEYSQPLSDADFYRRVERW